MESRLDKKFRQLQTRIGQVQSRQGSEGCYMELLNQAKQTSALIRAHAYMFSDSETRLDHIRHQLRRLPQNQNWKLVDLRIEKIRNIGKPNE